MARDDQPALPHPANSLGGGPPDTGGGEGCAPLPARRAYCLLGSLLVGYVGVYLCRKNLAVAIPLITSDLGVSREQVGAVAGWSTLAYAAGKFLFGPVVDRFGGRPCFLISLLGVAVFGFTGSWAASLPWLALAYGANRFSGSLAWGAMMKMTPGWFAPRQLPLAIAWLSLSIVFGGAAATLLAGQIAEWTGNNWRAVMGVPALILLVLVIWNFWVLPRSAPVAATATRADADSAAGFHLRQLPQLLRLRQFWVVMGLSFTLYLMREVFNNWTVDFFKTEGGAEMSSRIAAFLSMPFDLLGALGILSLGWLFGRLGSRGRTWSLFAMLLALTGCIYALPLLLRQGLVPATLTVGLIGFLSYGPYSLLAGILSVEIRGKDYVATVAGLVDGVGYVAGYLAGGVFGGIVDAGGYRLGFACLAGVTLVAAVLSLFLYRTPRTPHPGPLPAR